MCSQLVGRTTGDDRAAGLDHPLQNGQSAAPGRSPCSGSSMRRPKDQRLPISPASSYQLESHRTTFRPQSTRNPGVVTATDMGNRLTAEDDAEVRGAGPDGRTRVSPRSLRLMSENRPLATGSKTKADDVAGRNNGHQWIDRPTTDDCRKPERNKFEWCCRMIARASEVRSCSHCDRRQRCDLQQPER